MIESKTLIIWPSYISQLNAILSQLSVRDAEQREIGVESGFSLWKELTVKVRTSRNSVFFIGNGASASMASHFAADLAKNGRVRTEVFTDLSLITAIANDISYDQVFAEPLRVRMTGGDMLVAISSSGQSPNIIKAARQAGTLGGIVVTLSAMQSDNALRFLGKLNFYVPAKTYGMAETCHAAILHFWADLMATKSK